MIATFRKNNVRVMMDLATIVLYPMDMDKIREDHDCTFEVQRKESGCHLRPLAVIRSSSRHGS